MASNTENEYVPLRPIGKGAYGTVQEVRHAVTNETFAIKRLEGVFGSSLEATRLLRELRLLRAITHENITQIHEVLPPSDPVGFNVIFIVYEHMSTDLYQVIRSNQPLSPEHIRYFLFQLLAGLSYAHAANVMHRDLNPSNLLVNADCSLKICDFGLARSFDKDALMSDYVVTRWYRSPELLLGARRYDFGVDLWAVGCILAEMLGRRAIFPGRDPVHQLSLVCKVVGMPRDEDLNFLPSQAARDYVRKMPQSERVDLTLLYPDAEPAAVDLLDRLLQFTHRERPSAAMALEHSFVRQYTREYDRPPPPPSFEFEFDGKVLDTPTLRRLVFDEIMTHYRCPRSGSGKAGAAQGAGDSRSGEHGPGGRRTGTPPPPALPGISTAAASAAAAAAVAVGAGLESADGAPAAPSRPSAGRHAAALGSALSPPHSQSPPHSRSPSRVRAAGAGAAAAGLGFLSEQESWAAQAQVQAQAQRQSAADALAAGKAVQDANDIAARLMDMGKGAVGAGWAGGGGGTGSSGGDGAALAAAFADAPNGGRSGLAAASPWEPRATDTALPRGLVPLQVPHRRSDGAGSASPVSLNSRTPSPAAAAAPSSASSAEAGGFGDGGGEAGAAAARSSHSEDDWHDEQLLRLVLSASSPPSSGGGSGGDAGSSGPEPPFPAPPKWRTASPDESPVKLEAGGEGLGGASAAGGTPGSGTTRGVRPRASPGGADGARALAQRSLFQQPVSAEARGGGGAPPSPGAAFGSSGEPAPVGGHAGDDGAGATGDAAAGRGNNAASSLLPFKAEKGVMRNGRYMR